MWQTMFDKAHAHYFPRLGESTQRESACGQWLDVGQWGEYRAHSRHFAPCEACLDWLHEYMPNEYWKAKGGDTT